MNFSILWQNFIGQLKKASAAWTTPKLLYIYKNPKSRENKKSIMSSSSTAGLLIFFLHIPCGDLFFGDFPIKSPYFLKLFHPYQSSPHWTHYYYIYCYSIYLSSYIIIASLHWFYMHSSFFFIFFLMILSSPPFPHFSFSN